MTAVRRAFNYGILAVLLVAHGDSLMHTAGHTTQQISAAASGIHAAAFEQNRATLKLLTEKRARFMQKGESEKIERADKLIAEIEKQNQDMMERTTHK